MMFGGKVSILVLLSIFISSIECKWLFQYDPQKPCFDLKDGDYPVPNVFEYLHCVKNAGEYKRCREEYIFDPRTRKCVIGDTTKFSEFCDYRENGNYQNPWNCNEFIECVHQKVYVMPCPKSLVFDPLHDTCRDDLKCKQLPGVSDDNPCSMLSDGDYPIRDVMSYLTCKSHKSTYKKCGKNQIFDAETKECVDANTVSEKDFCKHRTDGDWSDPWNCNEFYKCFGGATYEYKCQFTGLVYDPYKDQCVYPNQYQCTPIPKGTTKTSSNFSCVGLKDGDYPIRDVFKYATCKNGVATINPCPRDYIFDANENKCESVSFESIYYFCQSRPDGNWVNPWACHRYLSCQHGVTTNKPCPLDWLIYDPYEDQCVTKDKYECNQIGREVKDDNPCSMLSDGDYPIRDVMSYLTCKSHKSTYKKCGKNQIFDAETKECVDANTVSEKDFCKHRTDGDWSDPWNCSEFYKCFGGATHGFKCQFTGLVYDPYKDQCVYPNQYQCTPIPKAKQNIEKKRTNDVNPCAELPDGKYNIREVTQYLQCKNHQKTYVKCPAGNIFNPITKQCTSIKEVDPKKFCDGRPEGNYRNPWNCHNYFTCVGDVTYDRPCSLKAVLTYDPWLDLCSHPYQYKCQNVTTTKAIVRNVEADDQCKGKADGQYPIPDVFHYLNCKGGKSSIESCAQNKIFSALEKQCVSISSVSLTSFCQGRDDGDWQNPWNCNGYLLCRGGNSQVRPCLINGFVFDPYHDVCVRSKDYPCYTVPVNTFVKPNHHFKRYVIGLPMIKDICTTLPDGNYSTRDVLQILQCKNKTSKWIPCPKSTIYMGGNNCTNASKISEGNFCDGRPEGDYMNPWDCHSYYVCHSGQRIHKQICNPFVTLNYDPVLDTCTYPAETKCRQLAQPKPRYHQPIKKQADEPCKGKSDGKYAIGDPFKYLKCSREKATQVSCPGNTFYSAYRKKCVSGKNMDIEYFCRSRPFGNYGNPWDCHSFITCHGPQVFNRPCSTVVTLNYNPYNDRCESTKDYPCKQLKTKSNKIMVQQENEEEMKQIEILV